MTGLNFLVVDWDYFFPNPMHNGVGREDIFLYDWGHRESQFHVNDIWRDRVQPFVLNGLPLPRASGFENFWTRFDLQEWPSLLVADSNLYAGLLQPSTIGLDGDHWARVDLYDAHHDSGYNIGSLGEWQRRGTLSCEDWMIEHYRRGCSELHVHYPQWFTEALTVDPQPVIPVDRRIDDGKPVDISYDLVFVCRSGAWVPPWCDDQFVEFLNSFPYGPPTWIDEENESMVRDFDVEQRIAEAKSFEEMLKSYGVDLQARKENR
jgi:hypothetical protein